MKYRVLPAVVATLLFVLPLQAQQPFSTSVPAADQGARDYLVKPVSPRDLLDLMPSLYALHRRGQVEVSIGDSLGFFGPYDSALRALSWDGRPQRWGGCQSGLQAVGIESDGGVKGCLSMQAFAGRGDRFLEGNLRSRALESIWLDPDSFASLVRYWI